MSVFPISICNLRHLRYLDLCENKFETLPETLSMLFNLQTLDLQRCKELRRLPKSLRLMRSLMHLYLDDCDSLECMPSDMGVLKRLRKVTRCVVGSEVGSSRITDLKHWNLHDRLKLVGLENVGSASDAEEARLFSKKNLLVLELEWGEGSTGRIVKKEVLQALRPPQNLKKLTITNQNYGGKKMPTWLLGESMLLKNLAQLELSGLLGCEHLPQVGQLPSLEVLKISGMNYVKQVGGDEFYGTISWVVFPRLRTIWLTDMRALEEWSTVEGRPSFPKVTEVLIDRCPKLKTMPTFPSAQWLRIRDCPLLSPARDSFACMRSLKRLCMGGKCEKLKMMLEQEEELTLDSLYELSIYELQLTPSSQLWKRLPSLQVLYIRLCSGLEGFHPEGLLGLTALRQLFLIDNPQLAVLPEFPESVEYVSIEGFRSLVSLPESMGRLPALKYLVLTDLPVLRTSLLDGYQSLNELWIKGCPGVESSLELLTLQRPSLRIFTDNSGFTDLPLDPFWNKFFAIRRSRAQHAV